MGSRREEAEQQKRLWLLQVIMPGYCVQGTIGHKILNGQRKLEMEGRATVRSAGAAREGREGPEIREGS